MRRSKGNLRMSNSVDFWYCRISRGATTITVSDSEYLEHVLLTNFQLTWPVTTLSCPPASPAKILQHHGTQPLHESSAHPSTSLGFINNHTALTGIRRPPSLPHLHGFLKKPNAWSMTHDHVPIFSPFMFRLLLEYARLVNDGRNKIGFNFR